MYHGHLMAASRCVGFALPLQTGAAEWRRQPYEKLQEFRKIELNPQRSGGGGFLQLWLGQGRCECRAGAKHDAGYKRSVNSKRVDSKKSEKYASVAEASGTGRQAKKVSRVEKNQVRLFRNCWAVSACAGHEFTERIGSFLFTLIFFLTNSGKATMTRIFSWSSSSRILVQIFVCVLVLTAFKRTWGFHV